MMNGTLKKAVEVVNEAITKERQRLLEISQKDEQEPICIEGETMTGYYCRLMVDPKDAAKIMLDYDYPLYHILGEDAPDSMWEDLGRKYGIGAVCSVDI